jgi:uncharacterized phage infection (PIP) family protein YhgE
MRQETEKMISEAAKKAAREVWAMNSNYVCEEVFDFVTTAEFIQSAIDAETDAALERAAEVCEIVALEREKQFKDAETADTAYTRNAQSNECRKLADRIRSLKLGSAK